MGGWRCLWNSPSNVRPWPWTLTRASADRSLAIPPLKPPMFWGQTPQCPFLRSGQLGTCAGKRHHPPAHCWGGEKLTAKLREILNHFDIS